MGMLSGPWSRNRAKSFAYLALAFWKRQIRRLFGFGRRDEGGVQRFLENYAPEGMTPLTLAQEEQLRRLGACIQCGMCEAMGLTAEDRLPAWSRAIAMRGPGELPQLEQLSECPRAHVTHPGGRTSRVLTALRAGGPAEVTDGLTE